MPVSGVLAGLGNSQSKGTKKEEKKGGFKLPSLGLKRAGAELVGGLTTLARVVAPGSKEGEPGLADVGQIGRAHV